MRGAWALLVGAVLAGCSGITPVDPPEMGANEMQVRPGAFSGPEGSFVLAGSKTPLGDPAEQAEVDAQTGAY
ncbi:hypothetical protein [Amaricoccus sp.]|uniref:hypothetical protein n=1 Tax=Amaricoccus sp. TaxID=1872485 RepID=UPI001B4A2269|nr:hypothetical protein [Amaricoccus sp.]MBP7001783.1 hypothetical protein [Amaricoccus sp.]